jgi:hypothetical protein
VKNPADPEKRRQAIYPFILGIAQVLFGQTLGLEINPLEPVGNITEIYHEVLKDRGLIGYKMVFETSYNIDMDSPDESGVRLLTIAADFMRQDPTDTTPDMQSENTLEES